MNRTALSCMIAAAVASLGAATQHEQIQPSVRVHRIYPVLAAAAPAMAPPQAPGIAAAQDGDARRLEDIPRMTVRGNASLDKPADRLLLDIGAVTQQETPSGALQENSRAMDAVVKAIRKVGLADGEYQTGHFDLQPVYSQRPQHAGVAPDWQPKIIAYRASNSVRVRTKKLDLAGQLIQAANEAGANQIGSIGFDLADPRVHRVEAINTATANAIADARTLAEAAGLELVRILSIDLDPFAYQPVQSSFGGAMMRTAAAESIAPPITAGDVTVTAGVTVVYEIRQR